MTACGCPGRTSGARRARRVRERRVRGDAAARSGFLGLRRSRRRPAPRETRMRHAGRWARRGRRARRFDVPAYDETRIDGMRALAARGLRRPACSRRRPPGRGAGPRTRRSTTSPTRVLDDEPCGRPPRSSARLSGRHPSVRRHRGQARDRSSRRGRSGDRRQWMALGAIAVVAAGAIGGVLMKFVFAGPGGPAHTVVAPQPADGFTRSREPGEAAEGRLAEARA